MNVKRIIYSISDKITYLHVVNLIKPENLKGCYVVASHFGIHNIMSNKSRRNRVIHWLKPSLGWVKLNTDGSVGLLTAGAGGIIRDFCGEVVAAFATPLQINDVISAELNGLILGLELCIKYGCNYVWIELDAMFIVQSIKDGATRNANYFYLFRKVKNIMNEMNVFISHIYMEDNVCADWLANRGSTLYDYEELNILNLDQVLKGMLLMDKACMPYFRAG
ncbi:Putative ribonuclease H protein [Dendrobium catenatum]|uniref:Ribonuclease H protein n=1 Tax=Dendrobium catenatum TaxID=906689 RepID=A0A2I0WAQ7_9ASPA|nr:Putative ribonuclease H protein [Dendrobium catenatum]